MTEEEIVNGLKSRDHRVFEIFIKSHQKKITRTCYGFVRNTQDAEDLAQEVFLEVIRSIDKFRSDARLYTWLYRIAVNKSLNFIRSAKRKKSILIPESQVPFHLYDLKDDNNINEDVETKRLKKKVIFQAIENLPERQKTAFILNKYEDLSYKEIAEILESTISSIESLIHRAKTTLQSELKDFYKKYNF